MFYPQMMPMNWMIIMIITIIIYFIIMNFYYFFFLNHPHKFYFMTPNKKLFNLIW